MNRVGMGTCIRESQGGFLKGMAKAIPGNYSPVEAEAIMALRESLTWVHNPNYDKVIFELDAKNVIDRLKGPDGDESELGQLLKDCKLILSMHTNWSYTHVPRQVNEIAHRLARLSQSHIVHIECDVAPIEIQALLN
ncbi:hypothetical protein Sjap_023480 [Stephania japonica]|uniref:RNase H type-1 domain-containing protein n=1 Tax=Stephania japonica TaxID=461633 RepID=A0AAP0EGW7_9MAGN